MFSNKSDFAVACLYFSAALLSMVSCTLTAPDALKAVALAAMTIFIAASFMDMCAKPYACRPGWRLGSRLASLLLPVPFFFCALSPFTLVPASDPGGNQIAQDSYSSPQEIKYLAEAEALEQQGKYFEAENHYRKWIDLRKRSHPSECLDGVLARILDLQGCHDEAERYYSAYERFVAEKLNREALANASLRGQPDIVYRTSAPAECASKILRPARLALANGRLLRILQTIPQEIAVKEFDYSGSILKCSSLPASKLGQLAMVLDLRPFIKDFRTPDANKEKQMTEVNAVQNNEPADPSGSNDFPGTGEAKIPGDFTIITTVQPQGKVLQAQQLRRHFSKIDRKRAFTEFTFADEFYPRADARFVRENYPNQPLSGYKNIASVRDLIPERLAIIDDKDYVKLTEMSGLEYPW